MTRWSVLVVLGAVLVIGASTVASASFFDLYCELPAPQYHETEGGVVFYPGGIIARDTQFLNVTGRAIVPPEGLYADSLFGVSTEVSTDSGQTWMPMTAQGHADWTFSLGPSIGGIQLIEAEMVSMLISGGNLPAGVQIRESPTRASLGGGSCVELGGGGYAIDSFFDIFTELTFDGGNTWYPAIDSPPLHMDGTPEPATLSLLALGGLGILARRRRK